MVIAVTPHVLMPRQLSHADKQICRNRVYERVVSNFSLFFFFFFFFGKRITQNYGAIAPLQGGDVKWYVENGSIHVTLDHCR